jgi:hypothetical protein
LSAGSTFEEANDPSWHAFSSGKWHEALWLDELERENVAELFDGFRKQGVIARRVRVVEFPITPYIQWELYGLRMWVESGERIRIITSDALRPYEISGLVPEVTILGPPVMYEILYDANSALCGGRKIDDPEVIEACRDDIEALYSNGEEFSTFFEREIAPLPPPACRGS